MSDYRLDITGHLGLNEYSNIYDYIDIVGYNDKFTISLDDLANENIDIISTMLKNKGFEVYYSNPDKNGRYYITASRGR